MHIKYSLYGQQDGKCSGCLAHFHHRDLVLDCSMPQVVCGTGADESLQLLCNGCKGKKSWQWN